MTQADPSWSNITCVPTDRKPLSCHDHDGFYASPLTFSANHSHCKTSAIKHWPAGDKEPSHLAGGAPYVTSPSYKQPVMALLPYTSPSYLPPCKPRSGKTTCPNNDNIRQYEALNVMIALGNAAGATTSCVKDISNVSHSQGYPGVTM